MLCHMLAELAGACNKHVLAHDGALMLVEHQRNNHELTLYLFLAGTIDSLA